MEASTCGLYDASPRDAFFSFIFVLDIYIYTSQSTPLVAFRALLHLTYTLDSLSTSSLVIFFSHPYRFPYLVFFPVPHVFAVGRLERGPSRAERESSGDQIDPRFVPKHSLTLSEDEQGIEEVFDAPNTVYAGETPYRLPLSRICIYMLFHLCTFSSSSSTYTHTAR